MSQAPYLGLLPSPIGGFLSSTAGSADRHVILLFRDAVWGKPAFPISQSLPAQKRRVCGSTVRVWVDCVPQRGLGSGRQRKGPPSLQPPQRLPLQALRIRQQGSRLSFSWLPSHTQFSRIFLSTPTFPTPSFCPAGGGGVLLLPRY